SGLHTYAEEIVRNCSINREWPLHAIAATLVKGRDSLKERVVFYANSREEFLNKLLLWCIEPKRDLPEFDKSQKLSPCMVAGIQSSQEAERICEALMKGAEPCWPEGRPVYRVNLSPVPLNKITHWAQFTSSETLPTEKFLGEMIISPQNRIFPVHVNKESFWPVSEHKLNDHATMVGMCFPALIGEVSKKIANLSGKNSSSIKIEGLTWVSTLQPEILEEGSVQIALTENDNGFMVSLQGLNRIDGWQEFTRASFAFISQENKKLDLQLIRKEMKPAGKEYAGNDRSENQQVKVSGRWDCRKQVWYSEDRRHILARLELDQKYLDDFNNTDSHPAMLDVAVSLALEKPGLIPVSCREIKLYKSHGNQCYSYVKIDGDNDKTDKSLKATCLLLDQEGTIVAEFIDMFFLQAAVPAPKLHKLTWYKSPAEITDGNKSSLEKILLLENVSGDTALSDDIRGMGVNITRISRPVSETEYTQISDLIHEKKFSTLVYRIPGNGFRIWELAGLMKTVISKGLREKLKILI
ncbi:MAG TPA: polyketide synthase dehydratase domain-containing protein, partial [Chitinispirillaceae bacterium]|nr:polyketide synthase dehydratase domain-containing protein [Chitinispirillaceae bacterium]